MLATTWCRRRFALRARGRGRVDRCLESGKECLFHLTRTLSEDVVGARLHRQGTGDHDALRRAVNRFSSELRQVSNLRHPSQWYPAARGMQRKLVYHAGPTNSGKTHSAVQKFLSSGKAIYCAPLRMLAHEIFHRANKEGVPCDLLTGEEKLFASGREDQPAGHLACTVEMARLHIADTFDVAVVDEVQMIKDESRGGAWTRAILGLPASEVHVCGHECALGLVTRLAQSMGERVEVHTYERLAPLVPLRKSLGGRYGATRPGDCIVLFSRRQTFDVRQSIETVKHEPCAIIYGGLPPSTRVQQAELFNSPRSRSNILVATDAIGMGLNLNIRRIVFHSLEKFDGVEHEVLNSSLVKQIAGRAGRYGSDHAIGEVTTFHSKDLPLLHELLTVPEEDIARAGLTPAFDQIELFSFHLPSASLLQILNLFFEVAQVDGNYFLCNIEDQLSLAELLQNVPLSLRDMFTFTLTPVNTMDGWKRAALYQFACAYSRGEVVDYQHMCQILGWPFPKPNTPNQLIRFENLNESIDLYLWLAAKFPQSFPSVEGARKLQRELSTVIGHSIVAKFRHRHVRHKIRGDLKVFREGERGGRDEKGRAVRKRCEDEEEGS